MLYCTKNAHGAQFPKLPAISAYADQYTYEAVWVQQVVQDRRCAGAILDFLNNRPGKTCNVREMEEWLLRQGYNPNQMREAKTELTAPVNGDYGAIRLMNLGPYTERVYVLYRPYTEVRGCHALACELLRTPGLCHGMRRLACLHPAILCV